MPEDVDNYLLVQAAEQAVLDAVFAERELWGKYTPSKERDQARAYVFRCATALLEIREPTEKTVVPAPKRTVNTKSRVK